MTMSPDVSPMDASQAPSAPPPVPSRVVEVVIRKIAQKSPWQPFRWQLDAAAWCPELDGAASVPDPRETDEVVLSFFRVSLYPDEAEGYYLNLTTDRPAWFVHFRLDEEDLEAKPKVNFVTVSYNEAGRLLDSSENVETFPIDPNTANWLACFTQEHYVPAPKKRQRPQSFMSPAERARRAAGESGTDKDRSEG